ncbi:hypothetical protein OPQ81_002882 [Rhizoctonia solani]|nr:hypothetical protein OPQ81_002882 [Rhizoctonia solani]
MRDGTDIAIKVLRQSSDIDPKSVKRAIREVYRWSKIRHPNIHELIGVTEFRGQLGMISLWMENGDLRSYIRKNPEINRYPWCIQVAAGVSYLHASEMIHGDLKASNILVSRDHIARISDFDCSIISDCSLLFSATQNTPTSLRWAAPELMGSSDDEDSTGKTQESDIYALGMTLLEIVTGDSPYSEYRLDFGVVKALIEGKIPRRPAVLSEASGRDGFWSLLVKCWNPDRTNRPGAQQILTQLQVEAEPPEFKDTESIGRQMSLEDMFHELLRHDCVDLSSQMDPNQYTAILTHTSHIGGIWKGDLYDGTAVAIKTCRAASIELIRIETFQRATRDIYSWSKIVHPNIHELTGVIIFKDHQLGMVSQWMENGNIHEYLSKNPRVDRYQICIQVTSGVAFMHNIDMVHGNIRAANVLVSIEGVAKLAGFGFSAISQASDLYTTVGPMTWRIQWVAPELLLDNAVNSKPADVYALGLTMLEIFTGKVPYLMHRGYASVFSKIISGVLPTRPVNEIKKGERGDKMWQLMLSCWDRDPTSRPTASQVLESLKAISLIPT